MAKDNSQTNIRLMSLPYPGQRDYLGLRPGPAQPRGVFARHKGERAVEKNSRTPVSCPAQA